MRIFGKQASLSRKKIIVCHKKAVILQRQIKATSINIKKTYNYGTENFSRDMGRLW